MKSTDPLTRPDHEVAAFLHRHPAWAWGLSLMWVLAVGGLAYLWQLGSFGLVDETEPLFSEAARQMLVTGDWLTPYFNGVTRFDKPPLVYWLMAIAYAIVGVNEWGARLPSALSAIALLALMLGVLQRYGLSTPHPLQPNDNGRAPTLPLPEAGVQKWFCALGAVALTGLTPLMLVWGRTGVSDMLLTACVGGAMLSFFAAYAAEGARAKTWSYLAFYICLGLGVLAKGPVAVVLPGLGIGAFVLYVGQLRAVVREMRLLWGGLLLALLVVPWFVAVTLANGQAYIDSFFGYHNFERFTAVVNRHSAPWYFYFLIVLLGFLPFSVHLPLAIARLKVWKPALWRKQPRSAQLGPFVFWWFASIFVFFTVAVTKLPSYVLPLMPAAAILVSLLWSEQWGATLAGGRASRSLGRQLSGWLNVAFFAALAIACAQLPNLLGPDSAAPDLPEAMVAAQLPAIGAVLWSVAAVAAALLLLVGRSRWLGGVNIAAATGLAIVAVAIGLPLVDGQRQAPIRELAWLAVERQLPQEQTISLGFIKPSITFYMQQTVIYTDSREQFREIVAELEAAGEETTMVIALEGELEDYGLRAPLIADRLGEAGAYRLVRVNVGDVAEGFTAD